MRLGPGDVRLTTRYLPRRPFAGLFATLHEVGHGLYDQHLPVEHYATPVGEPSSLALHESQSRLIENLVGRSRPFWRFALPRLQATLAPVFDGVTTDRIYAAVNRVARTTNRIQADEVTYDLHIAVRVDLERALLADDLTVADLPGAWADAYATHLVRPPTVSTGFLQDGHWAAGMFGYFPTYTLGNLIAAQLHAACVAAHPDLDEHLAAGRFAVVVDWLRDHVHRHGSLLPSRVIVERATGAPPGVDAQLARLTAKYAELF
jgi:carboxypeptidase Taq